MGVRVIRMDLEYEGTEFHGFAPQPGLRTVGGEVGEALCRLLGEPVPLIPGARTDAGVHALGQVVSCSVRGEGSMDTLRKGLNALTGPDILVRTVADAAKDFDARRDARSRRYEYRIWNAPEPHVWERRRMLHVREPLDVDAMDRACDTLIGRHDFGAFYTHRAEDDPPKNTIRRVSQTGWVRDGNDPRIVRFEIEADAFLRHMVRSIVGTALQVGQQKLSADGFARILAAGNRSLAGPTAPPHGLTLLEVRY